MKLPGALRASAIALVMAVVPMTAHAETLRQALESAGLPADAVCLIEDTSRRIAEIRATPEAQEGLSAFLEKRTPAFRGA